MFEILYQESVLIGDLYARVEALESVKNGAEGSGSAEKDVGENTADKLNEKKEGGEIVV